MLHGKGIAEEGVMPRIKFRKVTRSRFRGRANEEDRSVVFDFKVCIFKVSAHGFLQPMGVGVSGTVSCPMDSGAKRQPHWQGVARMSQHASSSKAHEPTLRTNNDVIIERDAQKLSCLHEGFGDPMIFGRRLWITGGMVMRHDDRTGVR